MKDYRMSNDLASLVKKAIGKATRDFRKEKKSTKRKESLSRSARKRLFTHHYSPLSIKAASFKVMEQAYMRASANNTLPANARQIMYQARPLIQQLTTKMWKNSNLFTQNYLPCFLRENPTLTATWDVVYDARGHFEEPHTQRRVDLGTLAVRQYVRGWVEELPTIKLNPLQLEIETCGPTNRFKYALFIEKEGFTPLLERSQIGSRYDIAIMSTKGMSVTASRRLIESLSRAGVTTLVAHDFDVSGFTIYRTLSESTTRYTFSNTPRVEYLGLRLSDVNEMGLQSETVDLSTDPKRELQKCGASVEEIEFLSEGERVELNAMDSAQFIDWLERKLEEHGVSKVVPNKETLESTYKLAKLLRTANEAITEIQEQWEESEQEVSIPTDLDQRVKAILADSDLSWDRAITQLEAEAKEPM
jgi:hypothetical protein